MTKFSDLLSQIWEALPTIFDFSRGYDVAFAGSLGLTLIMWGVFAICAGLNMRNGYGNAPVSTTGSFAFNMLGLTALMIAGYLIWGRFGEIVIDAVASGSPDMAVQALGTCLAAVVGAMFCHIFLTNSLARM
ncbi:MAG TPA: hypothetical protein VLA77_01775 [Candidatus Saccharimonadales bacterium]|nr:hypothetical protein [Candidatus Saccharimonadales bacterium]